jgi:hypothetical protein
MPNFTQCQVSLVIIRYPVFMYRAVYHTLEQALGHQHVYISHPDSNSAFHLSTDFAKSEIWISLRKNIFVCERLRFSEKSQILENLCW